MFNNFEIQKGLSLKLWSIKNHDEMRQYIIETCPQLCFNNEFIDKLATLQMEQLVQKKLELMRLAKNNQYSA